MSAKGNDNDNANDNSNYITFTIKDTKLYFHVVTLSGRPTKNYQNFLEKHLKGQFIGLTIKQIVRIKIRQINIDTFSNQNLLKLIDYLF